MAHAPALRVVFRAAAGPRIGYGHLVRTAVLGRAMGVPLRVSVRGTAHVTRVARDLGCVLVPGAAGDALRTESPLLLVIDDPSAGPARAWRREASRRRIPVASIHDLGLAYCGADLTIDGSVGHRVGRPDGRSLLGPSYLILADASSSWREPSRPSVLIALGGGPRRRGALALATAIRILRPDVRVRIAGGLIAAAPARMPDGVEWLAPRRGLAQDLASATLAVVGGGVSLYEACRVGTPVVAVAVVAAQRPTIEAVAARRAAVDGGLASDPGEVARRVVSLLDDGTLRARLSRSGRSLVDGKGASRVAHRLHRLASEAAVSAGARRRRSERRMPEGVLR